MGRLSILILVPLAFLVCSGSYFNETNNLRQFPAPDTVSVHEIFDQAWSLQLAELYDKANNKFQQASVGYQALGLWSRVFDCQMKIAHNQMEAGNFKDANHSLTQALGAVEKEPGSFPPSSQAKVNYSLGICHFYLKKFPQARNYYEAAAKFFALQTPPDSLRIGRVYNNIGVIYSDRRDFEQTLQYYHKALNIFQQHNDLSLVSAIYNNIGTIYIRKHDYAKALEYYNRSLDLKLSALGQDHIDVALAYNNLGAVYQESGDNEKAYEYYRKALANRILNLGPEHPEVALLYRNLGIVHTENGDFDQALENYQKALPVWETNLSSNHPEIATIFDHMGVVYHKSGEYEKALGFHLKALPIWRENFGEKDPDLALCYREIGINYLNLGQIDQALEQFHHSIAALTPEADGRLFSGDSLIDYSLSKPELLATLSQKAAALEARFNQSNNDLAILNQIDQAYSSCLLVIDKMTLEFDAEGSKLQLGVKTNELIGKAIDNKVRLYQNTLEEKYKWEALYLAEKNKAGRLRETLKDTDAKLFSGVPPQIIDRERQLQLDLALHKRELRSLFTTSADSQTIAEVKDQIFQASLDKEALTQELKTKYPKYHQYKQQWANINANTLTKDHIPANTALIEYYQGPDNIYLFLIGNDFLEYQKIPLQAEFEIDINKFLKGLKEKDIETYRAKAYELYQQLIHPAVELLTANGAKVDQLVIIPDGYLGYIPFETLLRSPASAAQGYRDLDYLVRHYQISYHYSADLLSLGNQPSQNKAPGSFLGFAPTFIDRFSDQYLAMNERTRAFIDTMTALPNAEKEVTLIAELLEGQANIGTEASEYNFKQLADGYSIVHLASHTVIEDEEPMYSKLLFDNEQDSIEDGFLHTYELYNMKLQADLVTLSACNTGIGKLYQGEGIISLARGFMYAGVPNLVMSLWSVSDHATKDLMTYFYEEVKTGQPHAAALRKAKLRYLDGADNITANPYYWGSFIYLGQIESQNSFKLKWFWVLAIGAGLVLIFFRFRSGK